MKLSKHYLKSLIQECINEAKLLEPTTNGQILQQIADLEKTAKEYRNQYDKLLDYYKQPGFVKTNEFSEKCFKAYYDAKNYESKFKSAHNKLYRLFFDKIGKEIIQYNNSHIGINETKVDAKRNTMVIIFNGIDSTGSYSSASYSVKIKAEEDGVILSFCYWNYAQSYYIPPEKLIQTKKFSNNTGYKEIAKNIGEFMKQVTVKKS